MQKAKQSWTRLVLGPETFREPRNIGKKDCKAHPRKRQWLTITFLLWSEDYMDVAIKSPEAEFDLETLFLFKSKQTALKFSPRLTKEGYSAI